MEAAPEYRQRTTSAASSGLPTATISSHRPGTASPSRRRSKTPSSNGVLNIESASNLPYATTMFAARHAKRPSARVYQHPRPRSHGPHRYSRNPMSSEVTRANLSSGFHCFFQPRLDKRSNATPDHFGQKAVGHQHHPSKCGYRSIQAVFVSYSDRENGMALLEASPRLKLNAIVVDLIVLLLDAGRIQKK